MAGIHITDIESAINYWRGKEPSPDGVSLPAATRALADAAADFKARYSLSLADAFAAALAKAQKDELVTGDAEFKPLAHEIKLHWLG